MYRIRVNTNHSMEPNREVSALLTLIDDPDTEVFSTVSERIISIGKGMISDLEELWENTPEETVQDRIEMLIHKLHFRELEQDFTSWACREQPDLLDGAFLVSRYKFPDLHQAGNRSELDKLCKSVWLELNNCLTPLEQINVINRVFYSHHMYKGVEISYRHPEDFLINKVLETKRGNSIANGILYQTLCQMLDIPVRAIQIPRQFILAYFDNASDPFRKTAQAPKILFFIDPLSGQVYTQKDVDHYFNRISVTPRPNFFKQMSNQRIIAFLIEEFSKCFDDEKSRYKRTELRGLGDLLLEKNDNT